MENPASDLKTDPSAVLAGQALLIVDDSAACRVVLGRAAEHLGMTVRSAGTAMEAVKAAGLRRFDFVMLDIGLEDADGRALATAFRASPVTRAAVIICISGLGGEDRHRASLDAGADMFIQKPFPPVRQLAANMLAAQEKRRRGGRFHDLNVRSVTKSELVAMEENILEIDVAVFAAGDLERATGRLERALARDDAAVIHRAAHFLSGVASLIGEEELERECHAVRQSDRNKINADKVRNLLALTRSAHDRLLAEGAKV